MRQPCRLACSYGTKATAALSNLHFSLCGAKTTFKVVAPDKRFTKSFYVAKHSAGSCRGCEKCGLSPVHFLSLILTADLADLADGFSSPLPLIRKSAVNSEPLLVSRLNPTPRHSALMQIAGIGVVRLHAESASMAADGNSHRTPGPAAHIP
jgi:hypothetical protein